MENLLLSIFAVSLIVGISLILWRELKYRREARRLDREFRQMFASYMRDETDDA